MRRHLKPGSEIMIYGIRYKVEFANETEVRAHATSATMHMDASAFDAITADGDVVWAVPFEYADRICLLAAAGCWTWVGEINRNGYGTFVTRPKPGIRKRRMAHIEVYVGVIGEYDRKLLLDHTCRNRSCCNPAHLEPVTNRVNTLRGEAPLFKRKDEYTNLSTEK